MPAGPACYDTNTASHNHLLIGTETSLYDAPHGNFIFDQADYAAMGLRLTSVNVLVRAQRKQLIQEVSELLPDPVGTKTQNTPQLKIVFRGIDAP